MRLSTGAAALALAATVLGPYPALAQSFNIKADQNAGPQTLTGAGDAGTVQFGGSIDATDDAVQMFNAGQSLTNDGSIGTSGNGAANLNSQGDNAVIINSGSIVATGDGSAGILVDGASAHVENSGTIAVSGIANAGIIGSGSDLAVVNNGSIEANGEAAAGIIWQNNGLRVSNSGSVVVSGLASIGIGAGGDDVIIDNTGLVQASGQAAVGIGSAFGTATINNAGDVLVYGDSTVGILAQGDNAVVTNSGRVTSDQGVALYFGGSNATLNLLAETAIQGPIVFTGSGNTATFGPGLSAAMTFSGPGFPDTILTGGRPFAIDGTTVAVADITGFASTGAVIEDLSGSIAGAVEQRLSGLRGGGHVAGTRAWISPFGTGRQQDASGAAAGFTDALGGVIAGVETDAGGDILAGAFLGAAGGRTEVDNDAQDITHRSVFGGGYLGYDAGARFADLSLTLGSLDESSRRRVANNLVLGGVEMARADFNGTFVSPSLTLGMRMPYGTGTLAPSLRLRYAGLFLGDYAETGSAGGLAVASRDVHVFDARAQLALAMAPMTTSSGVWQTTWRAGIDGVAQSAGDVDATLLGQNISFDAGGKKTALRGFVGAGLSISSGNGMTFGGDVETAYGSDNAFIAHAGAHLGIAF